MTKSELIKKLSKRYPDMSAKNLQEIVEIILSEVSDALIEDRRVEIRGFGAFSLRSRKARVARNPKTNEVVKLEKRLSPYFRAGKELRERINNNVAAN